VSLSANLGTGSTGLLYGSSGSNPVSFTVLRSARLMILSNLVFSTNKLQKLKKLKYSKNEMKYNFGRSEICSDPHQERDSRTRFSTLFFINQLHLGH
jgi:hypothetical protein